MAKEEKETYPVIPAKHWWALRERFRQSMPSTATPGFLATTLGMKESSARGNVIPSLVMMRIIDEEGNPTERAKKWRDDTEYPEICREMRNELYPQELLDAIPGPAVNRPVVERWFANRTGVGQTMARRFAVIYELLTTMTIPEKRKKSPTPAILKSTPKQRTTRSVREEPPAKEAEKPVVFSGVGPSIHIDIQIHISPDAKADQIDQIFASMAKHLGNLRTRND